jgi:hypothetical protein
MKKYCIDYSSALQTLTMGKQMGLQTAKQIFEFTKGNFDNEGNFVSVLNNYLSGKSSHDETENILFDNLIKKFRKESIWDWSDIGALLGNENVFKIFNHVQDDLTDKDYWTVLGDCYVMSSFSHSTYSLIKTFFQSKRSDKIHIMTEEEKLEFDSFPNEIEIYRGCSEQEIKSGNFRFSWTTKKSVAQIFAKRSKTIHGIKNSVVTRTIKKEEAFAYFSRRNEFEIIYFQDV